MEGTIGEIRMFAGNYAPMYWAVCDGSAYSIAEYTPLFAIIGTIYGGDGTQTFKLPDLRGRVAVGTGAGPGLSPIDEGEMAGSAGVTLLTSQLPGHTHQAVIGGGTATLNASAANATVSTPTTGVSLAAPGTGSGRSFSATFGYDPSSPTVSLSTGSISMTGVAVANNASGGSQPHNNMMPYLGVNFIICVEGIFPSRN